MQGCLKPITVHIPPSTILSPGPEAAVVGGNVLTSQRVTDVVLKAFNAAAASQACNAIIIFSLSVLVLPACHAHPLCLLPCKPGHDLCIG